MENFSLIRVLIRRGKRRCKEEEEGRGGRKEAVMDLMMARRLIFDLLHIMSYDRREILDIRYTLLARYE